SLVRAAAKNFRDVLVVVDPADYDRVLAGLQAPAGLPIGVRFDLARKAFAHTAAYDAMIAGTLHDIAVDDRGEFSRSPSALPALFQPRLEKIRDLRYGENPHQ